MCCAFETTWSFLNRSIIACIAFVVASRAPQLHHNFSRHDARLARPFSLWNGSVAERLAFTAVAWAFPFHRNFSRLSALWRASFPSYWLFKGSKWRINGIMVLVRLVFFLWSDVCFSTSRFQYFSDTFLDTDYSICRIILCYFNSLALGRARRWPETGPFQYFHVMQVLIINYPCWLTG